MGRNVNPSLPSGVRRWQTLAFDAIQAFIHEKAAVVWPEVEAHLFEGSWIHDHFDPAIPSDRGADPHHLTWGRQALVAMDLIREEKVLLQGVGVSAWLNGRAADQRRLTLVSRTAASKRRLYRTFLGWAGNSRLCGSVAEKAVDVSIESLVGRQLWVPKSARSGRISNLQGQAIRHGLLDLAGAWALDPDDHRAGFLDFGAEIKNIRSVIYPWHHETWELLAKVSDFPDVLPVLVARRIHTTTFRFFKDIGALGTAFQRQLFSRSISLPDFQRVTTALGFADAMLIEDPIQPISRIVTFFRDTAYAGLGAGTPPLIQQQLEKWRQSAPIVQNYVDMRLQDIDQSVRSAMWYEFCKDIKEAGLYVGRGWAPESFEPEPEEQG